MTSKEALERIKKIKIVNAIDKFGCPETIYFEEVFDFESEKGADELLKIIEQDLKVLEILKKHLIIRFCNAKDNAIILKDKFYDNCMYLIISKEEKNILKEWLENE